MCERAQAKGRFSRGWRAGGPATAQRPRALRAAVGTDSESLELRLLSWAPSPLGSGRVLPSGALLTGALSFIPCQQGPHAWVSYWKYFEARRQHLFSLGLFKKKKKA